MFASASCLRSPDRRFAASGMTTNFLLLRDVRDDDKLFIASRRPDDAKLFIASRRPG
jgi:hypothetical protein